MSVEPETISFEALTGRTEDQATFNEYGIIKVGDRSFKLSKPVLKKIRPWLLSFAALQQKMIDKIRGPVGSEPPSQIEMLKFVVTDYLDEGIDLICQFCNGNGLTREILESEASPEEFMEAFAAVQRLCQIPFEKMNPTNISK